MSGSRLVRNSPDLARLVQDGFAVRIVNGFLVIDDIPFVDDAAQVQWGSFLCPLDLSGNTTAPPSTHVMCFVGGVPRDQNGKPIKDLVNDGVEKWSAGPDLTAACGFSQKPEGGYKDFYEKVTYYTAMVISPAQAVDPEATPLHLQADQDRRGRRRLPLPRHVLQPRRHHRAQRRCSPWRRSSSSASAAPARTSSTLLAKTPSSTIHLYDGDFFRTHNAFRAPGAASLEDLEAGLKKVEYYTTHVLARCGAASSRTRSTSPPRTSTSSSTPTSCSSPWTPARTRRPSSSRSSPTASRSSTPASASARTPDGIAGQIRITTSTPGRSDHIARDGLISYFAGDDAEYDTNLQVDELNALTANLAVIRYKKCSASTPTSRTSCTARIGSTPTRSSTKYECASGSSDESGDGAA